MSPTRERATIAVEASAGKMLRSGKKRAVEEDEEQAAKPVARPKVENEEESADATNVARREQGEGKRDENADESEVDRDDHKDCRRGLVRREASSEKCKDNYAKKKKKSKVPMLEELHASAHVVLVNCSVKQTLSIITHLFPLN